VKINRWADALLASKKVRRDARTVIRSFNPQITNDAAAALRSTELPFLLAWGADDKAFKPALAERFRSEISTAELIMIEDCKTLVCWDQPERLAELISDFIKA
jgi:pimeloyl-ACP methyl ester carboxylesterase